MAIVSASRRAKSAGIIPAPVSHGINTYRHTDQWIFIGTISELGAVELYVSRTGGAHAIIGRTFDESL